MSEIAAVGQPKVSVSDFVQRDSSQRKHSAGGVKRTYISQAIFFSSLLYLQWVQWVQHCWCEVKTEERLRRREEGPNNTTLMEGLRRWFKAKWFDLFRWSLTPTPFLIIQLDLKKKVHISNTYWIPNERWVTCSADKKGIIHYQEVCVENCKPLTKIKGPIWPTWCFSIYPQMR